MVFEQFLESSRIKKHALFIFMLGIFYVFAGYIVSAYFFNSYVSVALLFTTTLLLVPSIYTILTLEEEVERKEGMKHFFNNHKDIIKIFVFLFIGIFFAYLMLGYLSEDTFSYQFEFLQNRGDLSNKVIQDFKSSEYSPGLIDFSSLVSYNLFVVVICFALSVIYGAGALFLITLNASIFAAFVFYVVKSAGNFLGITGVFLIHLIPELSGFLIAAIAGGIISRAIMMEKFRSAGFKNVMKDSLLLLLISAGLIIIAAFLEIFVSANLIRGMI